MADELSGIGKKEREQIAVLLNANLPIITTENTAQTLNINEKKANKLLTSLAHKGWLSRVKQGVYIPIPLQSTDPHIMVDEPWVLAKALFEPCYIGGWSAAEYWGLTEQIFNSTMVFSVKKTHEVELQLNGARLTIKTIKKSRMFGLKTIWQGSHKVLVSDATKTIIDAFNDPSVVGGIRMAIDLLSNYLKSEHKNLSLLLTYGLDISNTAIFKRLGFVLESILQIEPEYVIQLQSYIKAGYSQLDPASPGNTLITKWNLWVPILYKGTKPNDNNS